MWNVTRRLHARTSLESPAPLSRLTNLATSVFGVVIVAVLAIFIVAALITPVANLTTGVTIAHTGFTPNPNVTGTPGLAPIMQLFPLVFAFLGIIIVVKFFTEESRGI